ncbi:MAG: outer membrane beta-barrel protein [Pseudomonadota bacterium]|nr:outer membrane beta-barrel protein [Pseudomonadota bacterium]
MVSKAYRLRIAGLTLAALAPLCAHSAGFYVEAGAGSSSIGGLDRQELDEVMTLIFEDAVDTFTINDSSVDKSDTGFSLALGYKFTPNFAVEAAYLQLGKARYEADVTVTTGGPPMDGTTGLNFKISGPAVSLVGIWPVGERLSLDARAGAFFAKTKVSLFLTGVSSSDSLGSEKETSLLLGVGALWSFTDRLGLRLGYTRLDKAMAGEGDANSLSLGLRFSF